MALCYIGFVFIVSVLFGLYGGHFNPAWISCYVIGYSLGINEEKQLISEKVLLVLFAVLAIVGNSVQIYTDYIQHIEFSGIESIAFGYFRNYNHVMLGVFLFLFMRMIFCRLELRKIQRILNISDQYSYEVYLVHQFLILGPMSLMMITPLVGLNIVIILIGIFTFAWLLKKVENSLVRLVP